MDGDVLNITVKGGNSCRRKGMNSSCSIEDLAIKHWGRIRLLCRLNTRQEVGLLLEPQVSKLGERWRIATELKELKDGNKHLEADLADVKKDVECKADNAIVSQLECLGKEMAS